METLDRLRTANPGLNISAAETEGFGTYGRLLPPEGLDDLLRETGRLYGPIDGTDYEASSAKLEACGGFRLLSRYFGETEIQAGCCRGSNLKLNGMEYHKSSEIIGAATELLLMLGRVQDIEDGIWDSSRAECFFVPQGSWIELYATSLHLAPCRCSQENFRAVIVLPKGTNTPLDDGPEGSLWMKNKWLLAHPAGPAAARGAYVGISGANLTLRL